MDSLIIAILVLGCIVGWTLIMRNWRSGIYLLFCYTPVTGLVVAAMQPSPLGNLVKDFAIIIPLYIAFFLTKRPNDRAVLPLAVLAPCLVMVFLIAVETAAQGSDNPTVALIGAKVWLMYMPLMLVGSAALSTRLDLQMLLRTVVVTAWLPLLVGVLMWGGALTYDYQKSVEFLYGEFARNATQGFVQLKVGTTTFYRIPSTFQFVSQYSAFCQFIIFPILMLIRSDQARRWRVFGYVSLLLAMFAALTCGSRGAFLFLPFIFATLAILRIGARGTSSVATAVVIITGLAIGLLYFDQSAIFDHVVELTETNGEGIVLGGLSYAMEAGGMFGAGVGTGTIAARYAIDPSQTGLFFSGTIENFYAKAWVELGVLGFAAIVALLFGIIITGLRLLPRIRDPKMRDCGIVIVGMTIFVAFISTRGWALDQDPFAYYYYLFVGFMFKLPYLAAQPAPAAQPRQNRNALNARVRGVAAPGMRINLR